MRNDKGLSKSEDGMKTYRLLNDKEDILPTDEFFNDSLEWELYGDNVFKKFNSKMMLPIRREIKEIQSNDICDYCANDNNRYGCARCREAENFSSRKVWTE